MTTTSDGRTDTGGTDTGGAGRLAGRVALVTGSTSGIGAALAAAFVAEGARVVVTGRRETEGTAVADALGPAAAYVRADLSDEADVDALVAAAIERFGHVDVLVNNAGGPGHAESLLELDPAHLDRAFAVHVRAPFLLTQRVARHLVAQGSGSVINVASVSGQRAGFSGLDYSVAKAALQHLTRCAAVELGQSGVRVNTISPGPIATGIHAKGGGVATAGDVGGDEEPLFARFLPAVQPDPRVGRVEDVCEVAVFLASDGARFVNGQDVAVDGGITAGRPWSVAAAERAEMAAAANA